MVDRNQINPQNIYIISIWSKSEIQLFQSDFKLIEFDDGKRRQAGKPVENKNTMVYMTDISVIIKNNYFPFKNNIEYVWAKFI